jgi:NAD(P)-dependent dehydrogenase (short-subunit alcohol dehydrogenase family)
MSDLVILITGCSSGLGVETARALATTGATLFLTARVLNKAREALEADILSNTKVHLLRLDLDSLDGVRSYLCTFLSQSPKLTILITDAGIRHVACGETKDNSPIEFNDLNLEKAGVYTPSKGYARSKLAIVYMISEMTRCYGSSANGGRPGVSCLAVIPGGICTVLQQHADGVIPEFLRSWYYFENIMRILNIQKSPEQGAATSV